MIQTVCVCMYVFVSSAAVSDFLSELLVVLFNTFQTGALGEEVRRRGLLGHTHIRSADTVDVCLQFLTMNVLKRFR